MGETLEPATDNSGQPQARTAARVAITGSDVPRRSLSIALGVATIVLTVVGVVAVLWSRAPENGQAGAPSASALPPPTMRTCWDGAQRMSDQACAPLQGQQALTGWLVQPNVPFDSCTPWSGTPAPGELEVYDCLWEGQGVDVFVSRWDSVTSAQTYFQDHGRSRQDEFLPGGRRGAVTWVNDETGYPFRALVYLDPDQPYSINVVGQSAQDRDAGVQRITFRDPAELADQGADR